MSDIRDVLFELKWQNLNKASDHFLVQCSTCKLVWDGKRPCRHVEWDITEKIEMESSLLDSAVSSSRCVLFFTLHLRT